MLGYVCIRITALRIIMYMCIYMCVCVHENNSIAQNYSLNYFVYVSFVRMCFCASV